MSDLIKHMVGRFLGWKLPENFNPDGGITFEQFANKGTDFEHKYQPSGTNLFDAVQAEAMVRYMIEGAPATDETAWVIEAAWSQVASPSYLCVLDDHGKSGFAWTPDWDYPNGHNRALRFARKQDADAFVRVLWQLSPGLLNGPTPIPPPRIAEHAWVGR